MIVPHVVPEITVKMYHVAVAAGIAVGLIAAVDIAADSDGNIYVVDALFDNIQIFDQSGRLLMAWGGPGHAYGRFWLPSGIFIDDNDRIYVADTYNKRVQVFQYLKRK